MKPVFFKNQAELRTWFEKHHTTEKELLVGYYKTAAGKESITWSQSVDEALCFGWIDGIRRSVDEECYTIRFTPRKPGSNWSAINISKVEAMTKSGLMFPAGLQAFAKRKENRSMIYSYETTAHASLSADFEEVLRQNQPAWEFLQAQAPSYRKVVIRWIMSAKQQSTQLKRLDELISSSASGEWIKAMKWGRKK
jgi:uncharacterized protein YdeI (YjbR/CyaY-like superfamily)